MRERKIIHRKISFEEQLTNESREHLHVLFDKLICLSRRQRVEIFQLLLFAFSTLPLEISTRRTGSAKQKELVCFAAFVKVHLEVFSR